MPYYVYMVFFLLPILQTLLQSRILILFQMPGLNWPLLISPALYSLVKGHAQCRVIGADRRARDYLLYQDRCRDLGSQNPMSHSYGHWALLIVHGKAPARVHNRRIHQRDLDYFLPMECVSNKMHIY